MEKEVFQLSQLFPTLLGPEFGKAVMTERNKDECFVPGVGSAVFSVNNRHIRHAYHWSELLLRK